MRNFILVFIISLILGDIYSQNQILLTESEHYYWREKPVDSIRILEIIRNKRSDDSTEFVYNKFGKLQSKYQIRNSIKYVLETYSYNTLGNLLKKITLNGRGVIVQEDKYIYLNDSLLISAITDVNLAKVRFELKVINDTILKKTFNNKKLTTEVLTFKTTNDTIFIYNQNKDIYQKHLYVNNALIYKSQYNNGKLIDEYKFEKLSDNIHRQVIHEYERDFESIIIKHFDENRLIVFIEYILNGKKNKNEIITYSNGIKTIKGKIGLFKKYIIIYQII